MYTGSDSIDSQNYTQWALNPSAYQNMSNDQVDWAALAHQWIIMKETGPPIPEQVAPPAPIISRPKKEIVSEGGEAPMDVENDEDGKKWNESGSNDSWSWNQSSVAQQPPWGWNNSWPAPSGVPPPNSIKTPLLPTPAYNSYGSSKESPIENNYSYNAPSSGDDYHGGGYWNSPTATSSKVIKPHNKRYSKVNVPVPAKAPVTLDAAKRKTLPAWIREGLEKMERDKIKHLDKVKDNPEKLEIVDKGKLRENAMEILKSTVKEVEKKEFTAYEDSGDDTDGNPLSRSASRSPTPLTYEEKMLKVRRTMTEILLKVTNREIQSICREELQRHVRKLKASGQHVSAPSGANLSAKLGLGAYEGSEESSSESEDEVPNQGYNDSDSELRDVIRRRKEEFSKTERDIEHRLAETERYDSRPGTPDSDIVSQVDAKGLDRKARRSEELTPPPKLPHTSRASHKRQSSASSLSDSDTDINSKSKDRGYRDKRSSSIENHRASQKSRSKTPKSKHYLDSRRSRSKRSRSPSRKSSYSKRSKYSRSRSRSTTYSRRSRSRSSRRRNRSRSRRRSDSKDSYYRKRSRSRSRSSKRYRRSRSYSSGRGKRSYRQ